MSSSSISEMALPAPAAPWPLRYLPTSLRARSSSATWRGGLADGAVVAIFWMLVIPAALLALNLMSSYAQTALLVVSAAATHLYLRWGLGLASWAAAPMAAIYLVHPLALSAWHDANGASSMIGSWAMSLLPLLLLAGLIQCALRRAVAAFLVGGACGALLGAAVIVPTLIGAIYLTAGSRVGLLSESFCADRARRPGTGRWAFSALPAFAWLGGCLLASWAFELPSTVAANDAPSISAIGPLAVLDRDGLLARRLVGFPEELIGGGASWYLGASLIGLCLIAVWQRRDRSDGSGRTAAFFVVLAAATWWATRGSTSLHDQLVELFAYATVRRQTDALSQHILGVLVLGVGLWMLTVGLASIRLLAGSARVKFGPALLACAAVVLLWLTAMPESVLDLAARPTQTSHPVIRLLLALLLVCAAAAGLERIVRKSNRRSGRFALWLFCILALSVDFRPVWAGDREAFQPPGSPTTEIRSEGERVQVSRDSEVAPSLAYPPPPFIES